MGVYSQTLANVVLAAEACHWLAEVAVPVPIPGRQRRQRPRHQHLAELADRHAHVILEQVPGGHDLPLAASELCRAAIRDALADVDARRRPGGR